MRKELSATEAAQRKGVCRKTINQWCRTGKLAYKLVGGRYIIYSDILDNFVPPKPGRRVTAV